MSLYPYIPFEGLLTEVPQRERAWQLFQYPCIGMYSFLDFSISQSPHYQAVLNSLKSNNTTLLDLGCCFGQDIRRLVYDGAPAESIHGIELEPAFVGAGYDLFRDRETLGTKFSEGDFLSSSLDDLGLREGMFDFVHAAAFFHLFNYEEQVIVMRKAVSLLKRRKGAMLFGRQMGAPKDEGGMEHPQSYSGTTYRQTQGSLGKLMGWIGRETGVELECEVSVVEEVEMTVLGVNAMWARLRFCATVVGGKGVV